MSNIKYFVLAMFFLLLALLSAYCAYQIERDFGRIEVSIIEIPTEEKQPMVAKLYRPYSATENTPKPALLALHGYQSDKEATTTFGTLELAKRGFVVLAIDQFGHGFSTKLPASNKNMSGANNGYQYLKTLPFVDKERLGIFGHSTGALNAIRVAELNPDHKAINGLSGNGGSLYLNNYLLTQGLYEEIGGYREHTFPVNKLTSHINRLTTFGLLPTDVLQWDKQYGDINDGSARKATLVKNTHLGVMISSISNQQAILWFNQILQRGEQDSDWIQPDSQTYWYKEIASGLVLFFALLSTLSLSSALLKIRYFMSIRVPISTTTILSSSQWRMFAGINIVVTVVLYPLLTQWGGANEPIASVIPFMPLEMGNGIITWLTVSAVINLVFFSFWQRKQQINFAEMGIISRSLQISTLTLIGKSFLLSGLMILWLYLISSFIYYIMGIELRFLWPMLKPLTIERLALFIPYWLPILLFFFVFKGLILSIQMKQRYYGNTTLIRWAINGCLFSVGGLILLWLFHFVPNYLQIGPGFDVIGLPQFGGRWMMMLAVIIPQFIVLLSLYYWCYIKTGYIYLGIFFTSIIMTWILIGGQVIGRFLV